jgi:hypothetical protein
MNNFELLELSDLDEKSKQMIISTLKQLNESIIKAEIELFKIDIELFEAERLG